jgi:hypothetical protein
MDPDSETAKRYEKAIDDLVAIGVSVFVAAGNDGKEMISKYPSYFHNPITVAALDVDGQKSDFSTWHNEVDFAEQGREVDSIDEVGAWGQPQPYQFAGTSAACPVLACKGALKQEEALDKLGRKLTDDELFEALKGMALDINNEGFDPFTGYGFIQLKLSEYERKEDTVTNRISKFITWLREQVERGSIYVWGAQGQHGSEITEDWIRRREEEKVNEDRAIALWKKRLAEGHTDIAAYDCSGLIVFWLLLMGLITSDMSSRGLYAKCEKMNRSDLRSGDLVFRENNAGTIFHVGVYVGDNKVIESKGRDDGVVERDISASGSGYWNRYGRLGLLQESDSEPIPEPIEPVKLPCTLTLGQVEDGYMRIRTGPDTKYPYAGSSESAKVFDGETVFAWEQKDGWYHIVLVRNGAYIHGWTFGEGYR